ncbi:protein tyrosine kinase domain-containing protein [Ditylenchus destructor]|uniref:Protein tyrosine kinase domain-containing protein n=1 Tax=Ditylenchus destructor TaxID=166010 RepID=A0AAD4N5A3_9BILA|nr:protein tyrosine kinase domain-containing protein [Ditylenchus destructor]
MNRTLGILAEMNYVENGAVNTYATKFPYRIGANISHATFTWNATIDEGPMKYSIRAISVDFDVLPVIHLPLQGIVPTQSEKFSVEYRCAGSRSGQFLITLHFNISWTSTKESTYFTLKQEKICASKDGRRALAGSLDPNDDTAGGASSSIVTPTQLIYLGVGSAAALVIVCVGLLCFTLHSSRKAHPHQGRGGLGSIYAASIRGRRSHLASMLQHGTKDTTIFEESSVRPFLLPSTSTPYSTKTSTPKLPAFEPQPGTSKEPKIIFERRSNIVDLNHALVELNADRNLFVLMPIVEIQGTYGEIRWANWRQTGIGTSGDIDDEEDDASEDTALICKTLKHDADRIHFEKFIKEALMFHNVLAAATFGNFINPESVKDFPLISYRHNGFGILKKFLQTCRGITKSSTPEAGTSKETNSGTNQTLRTHDLVSMATQILKAMQHLHKFGIIHKDIAARNCLISELPMNISDDRLYVQLYDYALSRDLFPNEYYLSPMAAPEQDSRPVRWMAPEAIRSNVYNSASDIWTYGIFLWELFTCGQMPFSNIDPEDMQIAIASGTRPSQPYNCPDEFYAIMFSCWHHDPLERPSTSQLMGAINDFSSQLRKYI